MFLVSPVHAQISVSCVPDDQTWENLEPPTPDTGFVEPIIVNFTGAVPSILSQPFWTDTIHFRLALDSKGDSLNSFPISLPAERGFVVVYVAYFPDTATHITQGIWTTQPLNSNDFIFSDDTLTGFGFSSDVTPSSQTEMSTSVIPLADGHSIEIIPGGNEIAPMTFQLFNLLGEMVFSGSVSGTQIVNAGTLPRGVYFYRLRSGPFDQNGKIVLAQ